MPFKLLTLCLLLLIPQQNTFADQALFNGKDLTGWKGDLSYWSVKDGVIFGQTTKEHPSGGTFLVWDGEVADFELVLQARVRGNNSGIQYRSELANAKQFIVNGYQADIIHANHLFGMLYRQGGKRGIIAQRFQEVAIDNKGIKKILGEFGDKNLKWDANQWNEVKIVAVGNRLIHQVNGVTTVDVTDNHPEAARKGVLALQLHAGAPMTAEFKNIKLRKLSGQKAQDALKASLLKKGRRALTQTFSYSNTEKKATTSKIKMETLPGFKIEELFKFPVDYGSQVAMAVDDKGRLFVSGQKDKGLFRIELNDQKKQLSIEKMPIELLGTRGMLWHNNALHYYYKNGGLMRLWDSDGDSSLDKSELYPTAFNGSEHGSHSVALAEDNKDFYLVGGNHTPKPKDDIVSFSRVQSWDEDLLLDREWDGNNHARGVYAPGGHITRYNPDTKKNEIFSIGYRNQFDIAYNNFGDLFTYDADMEWDMGTPWYRPTRINFVASGSDYGWRSGSGKWPEYYEDTLPAILNMGPGSPTGMVSGKGAKFPAKYQQAVFAFDWTYGTINAIHIKPDGAGYKAERETFFYGEPMPLTDGLIGKDGALYFLTGGRGTDSRLYRLSYVGKESTKDVMTSSPALPKVHQLRRQLETYHGKKSPQAITEAWPHLASSDRWLRHAARVAVESQTVEEWADKALSEKNPQAKITASVALARIGNKVHRDKLLTSLLELNFKSLSQSQKLGLLRAYALTFIRLGKPSEHFRQAVIKELAPQLPADNADLNTELLRVLTYLKAPNVIAMGLTLIESSTEEQLPKWQSDIINRNKGYASRINKMLNDYPPVKKLGYAFILRNLKKGWSLEQRRQYISFLNSAAKHPGGNSYAKFLANIRGQMLTELSKAERESLVDVTGVDFNQKPKFAITPPKGPGKIWTVMEALKYTSRQALKKADLKNGRNLFHAAACATCHRFDGLGGDIGPDLSMVRTKFEARYLLESIIEPSKNISDQYSSKIITLKNKETVNGLVMPRETHYDIYPTTKSNKEVKPRRLDFDDVVKIEDSPISQMPPMLINGMSPKELRDLIAYMLSTGVGNTK